MSDAVNRALHRLVVKAISLLGSLVVLPFALTSRRSHA